MTKIPDKFTYPFCYTPNPMIVEAAEGLIARIDADESLRGLFAEGKMMGVLMVQDAAFSGNAGKDEPGSGDAVRFLYGFSGLAGGRSVIEGFVPPIFDTTAVDIRSSSHEESIRLQNWLFEQYIVLNARGESRSVLDIFADRGLVPPGGTGDCAAPKLLQYAYSHGLKPLAMGEFWYGAAPTCEVRRQGSFYPSCTGKCGPLLGFMLQGLDVEPNPLDDDNLWTLSEPVVRYEDRSIIVVDKPSGMLSVPGRGSRKCLVDWLEEYCGAGNAGTEPATDQESADAVVAKIYPVHRLDMDTSGLMVYAKTPEVQAELRRQFEQREVRKQYLARLCPAGIEPAEAGGPDDSRDDSCGGGRGPEDGTEAGRQRKNCAAADARLLRQAAPESRFRRRQAGRHRLRGIARTARRRPRSALHAVHRPHPPASRPRCSCSRPRPPNHRRPTVWRTDSGRRPPDAPRLIPLLPSPGHRQQDAVQLRLPCCGRSTKSNRLFLLERTQFRRIRINVRLSSKKSLLPLLESPSIIKKTILYLSNLIRHSPAISSVASYHIRQGLMDL